MLGKKTIRSMLNKILWSDKENISNYEIILVDRLAQSGMKRINLANVNEITQDSIILKINNKVVRIPIHRIVAILKNGEVFWKRNVYQR